MNHHSALPVGSTARARLAGAVIAVTALIAGWCGTARADQGTDTLARLHELSRQAEQLTQTVESAQQDLDRKLALLGDADRRNSDDVAALEAARAQLADRQGAVDRLAAAVYMGGSNDGFNAVLTAASPKALIDKLTVQRVMNQQAFSEMESFRQATQQAQAIQAESARSAADAKAAVDAAVAARTDLLTKQAQLKKQIATVSDEAALTAMPSAVFAALGIAAPVPTVGVGGLVPNARRLMQYVMATYPGVQSIGGVRADPLPDHPSGRALDIMIGSDMGLGDAINADIQSQAARFGVSYTMWRVANHFNHVHVTVF